MREDKNIPAEHLEEEDEIDLRSLLYKGLANWHLFVIAVIVSVVVAYAYIWYTTPIYKMSAKVLLEDEKNMTENILTEIGSMGATRNIENEMEVIESRRLLKETLNNLNFQVSYWESQGVRVTELYNNCPFSLTYELNASTEALELVVVPVSLKAADITIINAVGDLVEELQDVRFGEEFKTPLGDFKIKSTRTAYNDSVVQLKDSYTIKIHSLNGLVNQYMELLKVDIAREESSILNLGLEHAIPQKGVDFLNELLDVYIQNNIDQKNETTSNTLDFIDGQLALISKDLQEIEDKLRSYKSEKGITDISSEAQFFLESVARYDEKISEINIKLSFIAYLEEYLKGNEEFKQTSPASMGIEDPLLLQLIQRLSELENEKERLSNFTETQNPLLRSVNQQIKSTKISLRENIESIKSGLLSSKKETTEQLRELERNLRTLPATEYELIGLQRQYSIKESLYLFLLEKKSENSIMLASSVSDNRIIDEAYATGQPIKPKKRVIYLMALLAGLLVPVGYLAIKDFLNDKIISKTDLDKLTTIPFLGYISYNESGLDLIVFEKPKSLLSEAFRTLRANLRFFLREKNQRTTLVTSSIGGEGKSFCSSNLAAVYALGGKKTLLVGLDLRKPKLAKEFGLENDIGISNYLINQASFEDVVKPSSINENLDVVLSGPIPPNPSELLLKDSMKEFLSVASEKYDKIILDTPPIGVVSDALILADYVDSTVYVVRQNYTSRNNIDYINELHASGKINNISLVLNAVKYRPDEYKYGYGSGYGYGYGYGYYSEEGEKRSFWKRLLSR